MDDKKQSPAHVRVALLLWVAGLAVGIVAGAGVAVHLNAARDTVLVGR